jgi:hypothetical protein
MNRSANWLPFLGLLVMPNLATAIPLKEFMDTSFIGGGAMLFAAGLVMIFIPRMFRWGVLTMLLADILFMSRMFFRKDVMAYLTTQGNYAAIIEDMSRDAARFVTVLGVISVIITVLVCRGLFRTFFGASAPASLSTGKRRSAAKRKTSTPPPAVSRDQARGKRPRIDRDQEPAFGSQSRHSDSAVTPNQHY